jgi:hypothetical protein
MFYFHETSGTRMKKSYLVHVHIIFLPHRFFSSLRESIIGLLKIQSRRSLSMWNMCDHYVFPTTSRSNRKSVSPFLVSHLILQNQILE